MLKIVCFIVVLCFLSVLGGQLPVLGDDDLLRLISSKEKVIVTFSKNNCDTCVKFLRQLESLQDDFLKHMNAETVEAVNSQLVRLYSPTKEPAVVFFRHGIPLLYNGEPDENEIYPFFERNQKPVVKELNDKTFEHLTQAASGATTGDWLVFFYSKTCIDCQRLHGVLEGVGAILKGRINVARIDAGVTGVSTAKRFKVKELPSIIFFRLGKLYRYNLMKNDINSLVGFAQDWYKNVKGEPISVLSSPFDDLVEWCVELIRYVIDLVMIFLSQHPLLWQVGLVGFGLVAITAIFALFKAERSRPAVKAKKEKKRK